MLCAPQVRKANVVAVGPVTVLKLTAEKFKEQLGELTELTAKNFKRKILEGLEIDGLKVFNSVASDVQEEVLEALQEVTFTANQSVIKQEGANHTFYIIKHGSALVTQTSGPRADEGTPREGSYRELDEGTPRRGSYREGSYRELAELKESDYFGERGLVTEVPALASVSAGADGLTCYALEKKSLPMFGEALSEVLRRVAKKREDDAMKPFYADLEIRRIIGVGTFGRVKLVLHTRADKAYALKVLRKRTLVRLHQVEHVRSEQALLSTCSHPFLLKLAAAFQDSTSL